MLELSEQDNAGFGTILDHRELAQAGHPNRYCRMHVALVLRMLKETDAEKRWRRPKATKERTRGYARKAPRIRPWGFG
jgi:hypothetical protein